MLDSFLTFINQQNWDIANSKILVAVSGGIDSVVLLQLFHNAGFRVGIAHCNFGLRGEESDDDEIFVKQLSEKYGFEVHSQHFETKAYAQEKSVSTQMAARDLRYAWFEKVREEFGYNWIATAHHANDAFETTLLNLVRGTGITGLHGVPARNGHIIRPLLFASREEIKKYLDENNLSWREDRSNSSDDYTRNLLRHKVVPVLQEINPSLEKTFQTSSERIRAADNLLNRFLDAWKHENVIRKGEELSIQTTALLSTPEPTYCLWYILKDCGFGYQQVQQIYASLDSISGKVFYSATHAVLRDRAAFIVKPNQEYLEEVWFIREESGALLAHDIKVEWELIGNSAELEFARDSSVGYFALERLNFPLKIRSWQSGDTFCPFGMAGKQKKVSDLLIDLKFPVFRKSEVKVLVDGSGEIVWVMGSRTDERFKVSGTTEQILKISFSTDKNL